MVSLFIKDDEAQFRKFAILPAFQQQGLGSKLMKELIAYAYQQKLTKLWCNARINAKGFYLKFGFVETGQPYQVAGVDYIKMNRLC
ncbi:Acetyltransferase (GNAT) domain protein [compost metagenome]